MSQSSTLPFVFGGLESPLSDFDQAKVLIWPVPFEKTVSYGQGTALGPNAIIDASRNMELYDEELDREICEIGIHTLPEISGDRQPGDMMAALKFEAESILAKGKFLCSLGGEHSITGPIVHVHADRYPSLSVLQIDAHADLRESYDGTPHSHATAMRRVAERCSLVQVGIRSISIEEARAIPALPTKVFFAKDIIGQGHHWMEHAVESLTRDVYLTIDIDGLDPSLCPDTGTPEPGGLGWYETLALIRKVAKERNIVGMDLVEVSGGRENNVTAFVAAKLIYKTLGYVFAA